ncbi:hypothetical protein [Microbacterium sp. NPDC089695]|uniref:hypothetical protein n=1 Tax=Microbacterium sp. NPDC089695 TaxID=3364198 RepID=UPI0038244AC6
MAPPNEEIAVIGSSIAGLAVARVLADFGHPVTVFDRRRDFRDDGFGICLPQTVYINAIGEGLITGQLPVFTLTRRRWLRKDARTRRSVELWDQEVAPSVVALRWSSLRDALASRVPRSVTQNHATARSVDIVGSRVRIEFADCAAQLFDHVVGADGVHSVVRSAQIPVTPRLASYRCWRGTITSYTPPAGIRVHDGITIVFDGGHLVAYPVPGPAGAAVLNWVLYSSRHEEAVDVEDALPSDWAELIDLARAGPFPVRDLELPQNAMERHLLVGDAASITRPHTASGASKALTDAMTLRRLLHGYGDIDSSRRAFADLRIPAGNELVHLGRRLGRSQVESTPAWNTMNAETLQAWAMATVAGADSYLYKEKLIGSGRKLRS